MAFFTDGIRPAGKYYVLATTAAGAAVAALLPDRLASVPPQVLPGCISSPLWSSGVCSLCGRSPRLTSPPWFTITLNDLFIFLVLLLYSPAVAVTAAVVDGLISGALVLKSPYRDALQRVAPGALDIRGRQDPLLSGRLESPIGVWHGRDSCVRQRSASRLYCSMV